ncbi:MAG: hypothetical protein ACRD4B_07990 [Acidobacteriota bacterium]
MTTRVYTLLVLLVIGATAPYGVATAFQNPGGGNGIQNPLTITSVSGVLTKVTQFLLGLSATLALLGIVVGGIMIILAFGREDKVAKGKQILFWSIAGLVVIVLAYAIIAIITRFLGIQAP